MYKKLLLILSLTAAIISCNKSDNSSQPGNTTVSIDPVGTWSMTQFTQTGSFPQSYSETDHSCMANNKFDIHDDKTSKAYYDGDDSCYVYKTNTTSIIIGMAGQQYSYTWTQAKDTVVFTRVGDPGFVSKAKLYKSNDKEYMSFTEHFASGSTSTTDVTIYQKQ